MRDMVTAIGLATAAMTATALLCALQPPAIVNCTAIGLAAAPTTLIASRCATQPAALPKITAPGLETVKTTSPAPLLSRKRHAKRMDIATG